MGKEKREKKPGFIKFANSPSVSPPITPVQPATGDIKNRFIDSLVELKRAPQVSQVPLVEETHVRLVNLLTSIIKNQRIEDGEDLRFFLGAYNTREIPTFIFEEGKIVKPGAWLVQPYISVICEFVEFLASQNLQKIKSCDHCKRFFTAKRARYAKFCSPRCRFSFHRPGKEEWRKYIKRYRNLKWYSALRNQFKEKGCSPKEIGELIKQAKQLRTKGESRKRVETYLGENWKKICKHA